MEWLLEVALIVLLAATLFHAIRLERALGVLKRDRVALEAMVTGFNESTQLAEQGIERLRAAAEGAGRQIARQTEIAGGLKDDLLFLIERGERIADRLDDLVRAARPLTAGHAFDERSHAPPPAVSLPAPAPPAEETPRVRSQAERDLLRALRMAR